MVNLTQSRRSAHDLIRRWSGGQTGRLVRGGVARVATMALRDYRPSERGNFIDGSVSICISVLPTDPAPDHSLDQVEFAGRRYNILPPIGGPRPDGSPIYYDCNCVYVEDV